MERLYFHGVAKVWVERRCSLCFDGYMAGCGWRGGVQCVRWVHGRVWVERGVHCALMGTWQGVGGEVVFSVFDGYMAGCGWRGSVQCALMGTWQGVGGEVVFSVFDGYMAGVWVERWCSVCLMGTWHVCGWRGSVQCV